MIEKPRYLPEQIIITREHCAIGVLWLFQLSAIFGISLGFKDWFIEKTPLNLMVQVILLFWVFQLTKLKEIGLFILLFGLGMTAEIIGVATGFPFGTYSYGSNLGIKVFDVPLLIGCNWAVLVFCGATLANRLFSNLWLKAAFGGLLMVVLDFPMEILAPTFDFWEFAGVPPIENYLSWFLIGALMHLIFHSFEVKGSFGYALNLYLAQFLFFAGLALLL